VSILLKNVGSVLFDIYSIYFQHEIRGSDNDEKLQKLNEKSLFEFLRDYDICPTLITKGIAHKIYLSCIEDNGMSTYQSTGLEILHPHLQAAT
jgi:hypothetical protein